MHLKSSCALALLAQIWFAGMLTAQEAVPAAPSTNAPPVQAVPVQAAPELTPDDPLMKALAQKPAPESLSPRTAFYYLLNAADITVQKDGSSRALLRRAIFAVNPDLALNSELSSVNLRYDASLETVKLAYARIIDVEGKPHDLDLSQVRDKPYYAMGDATWDEHLVTLLLPKLKPGEILDYEEARETKARVPGHFEYRCGLGSDRLTLVAESMALHFPAELGLTKTAVRCDVPVTETKSADGIVTWKIEHSAIAKSADTLYVPNAAESWRGYIFSTPWTWDALAAWYKSQSAGRDTLPPEAIAEVTQDKLAYPDAAGLAFTLYQWVVESTRTFNIDFNATSDQPHSAEQTLRSHCGDAKDQALLLQALLRQAGIPSSLVLLRKGYGGRLEGDQATRLQFDHCLVAAQIDGKDCYLDPTADATELGWLPLSDCNVQALKIGDDKAEIITLPPYQPREKADYVNELTEIHPDGSAVTTSQYQFEGELATKFKSLFSKIPLDKAREGFAIMFKHGNETLTDFERSARAGRYLWHHLRHLRAPLCDGHLQQHELQTGREGGADELVEPAGQGAHGRLSFLPERSHRSSL